MSETLNLKIVTAEKNVYESDKVEYAIFPGAEGDIGVLPAHTPFLASLTVGIIKVTETGGEKKFTVSTKGVLEINENKIKVLASVIESEDEIDVDRAQKARNRAETRLKERAQDVDIHRAEIALKKAVNRLKCKDVL